MSLGLGQVFGVEGSLGAAGQLQVLCEVSLRPSWLLPLLPTMVCLFVWEHLGFRNSRKCQGPKMGTRGLEERRERRRKEGRKLKISRERGECGGGWRVIGPWHSTPCGWDGGHCGSQPSIEPSQVLSLVWLPRHRSPAWCPLWGDR